MAREQRIVLDIISARNTPISIRPKVVPKPEDADKVSCANCGGPRWMHFLIDKDDHLLCEGWRDRPAGF